MQGAGVDFDILTLLVTSPVVAAEAVRPARLARAALAATVPIRLAELGARLGQAPRAGLRVELAVPLVYLEVMERAMAPAVAAREIPVQGGVTVKMAVS
jgi:hypothetical protein